MGWLCFGESLAKVEEVLLRLVLNKVSDVQCEKAVQDAAKVLLSALDWISA